MEVDPSSEEENPPSAIFDELNNAEKDVKEENDVSQNLTPASANTSNPKDDDEKDDHNVSQNLPQASANTSNLKDSDDSVIQEVKSLIGFVNRKLHLPLRPGYTSKYLENRDKKLLEETISYFEGGSKYLDSVAANTYNPDDDENDDLNVCQNFPHASANPSNLKDSDDFLIKEVHSLIHFIYRKLHLPFRPSCTSKYQEIRDRKLLEDAIAKFESGRKYRDALVLAPNTSNPKDGDEKDDLNVTQNLPHASASVSNLKNNDTINVINGNELNLVLPCASTSSVNPESAEKGTIDDLSDDDLPLPLPEPPPHVDKIVFEEDDIVWVRFNNTILPAVVYKSFKILRVAIVKFIAGKKRRRPYFQHFTELQDIGNQLRNRVLLDLCISIDPSAEEAWEKIETYRCLSYRSKKSIPANDYLTSETPANYFDFFPEEIPSILASLFTRKYPDK